MRLPLTRALGATLPGGRAGSQRSVALLQQHRRGYQGNLQDKDRIYTNLYNDQSPYLEAAKKRVRAAQWLINAAAAARRRPPPCA